MPNYTANYRLKKPLANEYYNIEDFNENADIIDQKLKEIDDKLQTIKVPVTSVNGKTGDVELKAEDIGAETPTGAQAKAAAALDAAKVYTDQEIAKVANDLVSHKNENATGAHKAKNIAIEDAGGHFTATDVEGALNELFTSVSNGKSLIATAITDKGIPASGSDTFSQLANKIEQIEVGDYKVGDILNSSKFLIAPEVWKFTGHTDDVYAVAVDNNGNVYSGSSDNTVRKISSSGNEVWKFTGHTDDVYAVAVDNNGNVYSGSSDNTVRKISPDGNQIWRFTGHTGVVYAVAVDNNGNVYSGSTDNTVRKIIDGIKIIA